MDNKNNVREEEAKKIVEDFEMKKDVSFVESIVKNNYYEFVHKNKTYKIKLLSNKEKENLNQLRLTKFNEMIQKKDSNGNFVYIMEKELIKLLELRGINIKELDDKVKILEAKENDLMLQMGESIEKKADDTLIVGYKNDILDVQREIMVIKTQKNILLESSLENQLLGYTAQVACVLSTEVFDNEKHEWIKAYETVEKFSEDSDEELIDFITRATMLIQYI